jgi:hypothetical protein
MTNPIEYGFAEFARIISALDRLRRFLASHNIEPYGGLFDPNGLDDAGPSWAVSRWCISLVYSVGQYRLTCELTITAYPVGGKRIPNSIVTHFLFNLDNKSTSAGVSIHVNRETGHIEPSTVYSHADCPPDWTKPFVSILDNIKSSVLNGQRAEEEVFSNIARLLSS